MFPRLAAANDKTRLTMDKIDKKTAMNKISAKIGRDRAIEMVLSAYNTEIIATRLRHLESDKAAGLTTRTERRDHLANALERVAEVCGLAE